MREIRSCKEFDQAVESLGGYRAVDKALDTIIDGLVLNPYGFPRIENDWVSFRYAITKEIDHIPALVVCFQILENRDVELMHIELFEI